MKLAILALMLCQSVAFAKPADKAPVPAAVTSASKGDGKDKIADCVDGTEAWSSSTEHRGLCSGHGGVAKFADGTPVKSHGRKTEYR